MGICTAKSCQVVVGAFVSRRQGLITGCSRLRDRLYCVERRWSILTVCQKGKGLSCCKSIPAGACCFCCAKLCKSAVRQPLLQVQARPGAAERRRPAAPTRARELAPCQSCSTRPPGADWRKCEQSIRSQAVSISILTSRDCRSREGQAAEDSQRGSSNDAVRTTSFQAQQSKTQWSLCQPRGRDSGSTHSLKRSQRRQKRPRVWCPHT